MKQLLILRHAKSSWSNAFLADHDRPLNSRGRRDAPRMGQLLLDAELEPDLVLCSSAERARATAEAAAEACGHTDPLVVTGDLYHAGPQRIVEVIAERAGDANRVLVVGHNPGMEELVERFGRTYQRMPTAALAHIELQLSDWSELTLTTSARVVGIWRPRELV